MKLRSNVIVLLAILAACTVACKKDYYRDTGRHTPNFDGTVLEYLKSKPEYFDSIVKLVQVTGLENAFQNEEITFFAPADSSIRATLEMVSMGTSVLGFPEVKRMDQIAPEVWRKYLTRYLFKGKKSMNDFRQLDPENLSAYAGQIYESYDGGLMNAGVVYEDAGGVKYAGYRYLSISFIPSASAPLDYSTWWSATVASVNVAPKNGYVHVLRYSHHYFGFSFQDFLEDVISAGIKP